MKRSEKTRAAAAENAVDELRLPQIEPVRLYRQIANLLSERIDQGIFPIGTLLPAERELAQQLGVSRTSVREALIALEVRGKVSVRVGHGVQVMRAYPLPDGSEAAGDEGDSDIGPIELMEARRHVELKTVELAAVHRTDANLKHMRKALDLQASAKSTRARQYREGDRNFHVEIARAGGNAAYALITAALWDYPSKPLFNKFEELLLGPERLKKTRLEHSQIYDAIADRDRIAARKAMKTHLDAVISAFSRGLDG